VASAANAALLCGTAFTGCHGACEARHTPRAKEMGKRGFVIRHGKGREFDPRFVKVILFGGVVRWLGEDGRYSEDPPAEEAA